MRLKLANRLLWKVSPADHKFLPVSVISIERCGRGLDGVYRNMRGKDISEYTAALDNLVIDTDYLSIGIGDGGNEIGMGNIYSLIKSNISEIEPSVIKTSHLILATTSNWGAYGLIAAISKINKFDYLPDLESIVNYLNYLLSLGCVDGIKGKGELSVDGFPIKTDELIINQLRKSLF